MLTEESPNIRSAGEFIDMQGRTAHICRAILIPDEEGGFTAIARNLPGVVSEGDTFDEAIRNIKDAFENALIAYAEQGMPIPWYHGKSTEEQGRELHLVVELDGEAA